jgi:signal transduction histidine kinase
MTFSTLRSADGEPLGIVVACEDLSAIRRMEARMRHSDRLATLGRMSANIAHEIRNPLASMTGAIEALTAAGTLGPAERAKLTDIVLRESGRLNRIVSEFLAYARPAPLMLQRTDLAEILDDILVLLQHRPMPAHVKVTRAFEGPLSADVDPGTVRQAIWNLCLNALEAMPDGGELVVGATDVDGGVRISIKDSGPGIASGDLGHIFEPFYSTKPQGSGLGLALVHRIIALHGGHIDVRSSQEEPRGTVFTIRLPVTKKGFALHPSN